MSGNESNRRDLLVLGAGQLGMAVLRALAPCAAERCQSVTVVVSPQTVSSSRPGDIETLGILQALGVEVIGFDLAGDADVLKALFERYRTVVNCTGMFTSFLFEPEFDVVNLATRTVHGLGSWNTRVTVTTPEDIGRLTTEILLTEPRIANEVVYVAGDTISYGELAEVVERVTGQAFEKTLWSLDKLRADLAQTPDDVMTRYRAAFALGDGMWWDKATTFNAKHRIETVDVARYLRHLLEV